MFNILDFIDSKDIREHNKNHIFTPAEQAVLIVHSYNTTIYEKIDALKELVNTYDEEGFQADSVYSSWGKKGKVKDFRAVVEENIKVFQRALDAQKDNEGVVFSAGFVERKFFSSADDKFFSSYDLAYKYILSEKQYYLEDEDLCEIETFAYIKRMKLDDGKSDYTQYDFDNEMRLIQVIPDEESYNWNRDLSEQVYMYIPLPFKAGDIVKVSNPLKQTYYGVIPNDIKTKEDDIRFKIGGDGSDLIISLDIYDEKFGFDYTDDTPILQMLKCEESELPKEEKLLKLISLARKGEMDWMYLLYMMKPTE